jgi:hypothetical protein
VLGGTEFVSLVGQFDKRSGNGKMGNVPREFERTFKGLRFSESEQFDKGNGKG